MGRGRPSDPASGAGAGSEAAGAIARCGVQIRNRAGTGTPCRLIHTGKTRGFTALGTPTGGSYSWTISGGKASIASGAGEQTVEIQGDTASASLQDCTLTVTYTREGRSSQASIRLTVYELRKISVTVRANSELPNRPTPHPPPETLTPPGRRRPIRRRTARRRPARRTAP